jgi:lyso-ornithine lipid O-acyltransferase
MRATRHHAAAGQPVTALDQAATWEDRPRTGSRIGNPWLAASRLIGYGLLTIGLLPVQIIALVCWPALARAVPRAHHRLTARIIGLKIRGEGDVAAAKAVFFVCNHVSYFDIIALGSIIPASFVAKSDVARWPIFGVLARLCRTLFVERRSTGAREHIGTIRARLDAAESLIVFPEGTSSDGSRVLPFKSTLFAAVEGDDITVQPVSISYARLNGIPIGRAFRPFYAWFGDMDLAPHLWSALSLGSAEIIIRFHDPIQASDFPDRKMLAKFCHARIATGIGAEPDRRGPA